MKLLGHKHTRLKTDWSGDAILRQGKASQSTRGNSAQPNRTTLRKGNIWPFQRTINHIHTTRLTCQIFFQSGSIEAKFQNQEKSIFQLFRETHRSFDPQRNFQSPLPFVYYMIIYIRLCSFKRTMNHVNTTHRTNSIFVQSCTQKCQIKKIQIQTQLKSRNSRKACFEEKIQFSQLCQ